MNEYLTFDDVLLLPQYSEVLPVDANIASQFTKNIKLSVPFASSAMDTVTESKMAIALARAGGIGVIHKNFSIQQQVEEVLKVKAAGKNYSESANQLVSGLANQQNSKSVSQRLSKSVSQQDSRSANQQISKTVNQLSDQLKTNELQQATLDKQGRLAVAAAVGANGDFFERAKSLAKAGADALVIDTAHGHSKRVIESLKKIKKEIKNIEVVAGNVATAEAVKALFSAGADAVKVGIGPGSICTTRIVSGFGAPQLSAIMECYKVAKKFKKPLIADGGIKYSGDIVKAIAAGASCVMIGSLFAGTDESPGEVIEIEERKYKSYRGMGSLGAMEKGSKDRYGQEGLSIYKLVPEGIEASVLYKGEVEKIIYQLAGGLKSGLGYCGAKDLQTLKNKAKFIRISNAGLKESHPHTVNNIQKAPNY